MTRRGLLFGGAAFGAAAAMTGVAWTLSAPLPASGAVDRAEDWLALTPAQWRARLTPAQFNVLRQEGTERAFTSPLEDEKRPGVYHCAGCDLELFDAAKKYNSGTGWPSFWEPLAGALGFKRDYLLWTPRVEYHCARCAGHQGHVFEDGPPPTGLRFCNNGVALTFKPAEGA